MNRISEIFGKKVFNDKIMKEKLPKDAYNALRKHIEDTKSHELENALAESDGAQMNEESARYFCDVIIPLMTEIRTLADELEVNTSSEFWPMPTYGDLLFA